MCSIVNPQFLFFDRMLPVFPMYLFMAAAAVMSLGSALRARGPLICWLPACVPCSARRSDTSDLTAELVGTLAPGEAGELPLYSTFSAFFYILSSSFRPT